MGTNPPKAVSRAFHFNPLAKVFIRVERCPAIILEEMFCATPAGLSGATMEHYKLFLEDEEALDAFTAAANLLANTHVPASILRALSLARLTALQKPTGGVCGIVAASRPLSRRPPGRSPYFCHFTSLDKALCSTFFVALSTLPALGGIFLY